MIDLPLFARLDQDSAGRLRSEFLTILGDGRWHKGKSLCQSLATNERTIRAIADQSAGQVISGSKGYRLLRYASNEEIDHAEGRLLSQARKMTERAVEIRVARNQRGRAA